MRRKLLLALAVALATLAGLEKAGPWIPWLMSPEWQQLNFVLNEPFETVPDAELGFLAAPDQHELVRTPDYTYRVETDHHGFPNREPWPAHPAMLFLGDSLTLGVGVGLPRGFVQQVGQRLNRPVVNLGLAAAGPARQAAVYRRFGARLGAHLVVAALYLASDVDNDLTFRSWLRDGHGADYRSYSVPGQTDGGLSLLDRSWLFSLGREALLRWTGGLVPRYRFADGTVVLFARDTLHFATASVPEGDPAVAAVATAVMELREDVRRQGAAFLLLLLPSKEELFGVPTTDAATLTVRVRQRLQAEGVDVLDLYLSLRTPTRAPFYRTNIHLNDYGNDLVAQAVAAWAEEKVNAPR